MSRYFKELLFLLLLFPVLKLSAQPEKRWIKHQIATLSGTSMQGRGYVNKGVEKAALYLRRNFKEFGLLSFSADSSYFQNYSFQVNTFPGAIYLKLNKKELEPGPDYIIDAGSNAFSEQKLKLRTIDLKKVKDSAAWDKVRQDIRPGRAYLLKNSDTVVQYLKLGRSFSRQLPQSLFIIPKHGKLTWTVATDTIPATVFYVEDTVMPRNSRKVSAMVDAKLLPSFKSQNVIGMVPGTAVPDSFIVISAHFDHLGRMGREAMFPGAHDNASGTSLMLFLASYYARNPQRYTMVFIGFSGEEAGLLGSKYFTEHPLFPLGKTRFVINLDMTGDATNGITVVNAVQQKEAFELLNQINAKKSYLPKITERDQTHNSDHYHFSQAGVPAIFIYGNGTKGFYHDVFDKVNELSMENIDSLAKLLQDFITALQQ